MIWRLKSGFEGSLTSYQLFWQPQSLISPRSNDWKVGDGEKEREWLNYLFNTVDSKGSIIFSLAPLLLKISSQSYKYPFFYPEYLALYLTFYLALLLNPLHITHLFNLVYKKWIFPMSPHIRLSVGWSVGLPWIQVSLPTLLSEHFFSLKDFKQMYAHTHTFFV